MAIGKRLWTKVPFNAETNSAVEERSPSSLSTDFIDSVGRVNEAGHRSGSRARAGHLRQGRRAGRRWWYLYSTIKKSSKTKLHTISGIRWALERPDDELWSWRTSSIRRQAGIRGQFKLCGRTRFAVA